MNKTVNINLAGTFFHIDEDAFEKLNRYLNTIKRSFSSPQGSEEIIKDIEARIAELFSEKITNEKQVITLKELDEVIAVMGQPEDYAVDEEFFTDSNQESHDSSQYTKSYKKLYRDTDDKIISGVSSGLGHYIGLDAIWVRLIWILLSIFTSGTFILIYIIFWILVPEAITTADKLTMRGEPVNISNIEKKFKETYDNVAQKVKDVDYDAYGKKIKSGSNSFFDAVGKIALALLTVFVKFIGVLIIILAATTLISLFIGLFITGISGFFGNWYVEYFNIVNDTSLPIWLLSLIVFFVVGIPFFFLFILGLKILVNNIKSIGRVAKFTLLGIWILALLSLISIALFQALERSHEGNSVQTQEINIKPNDTLYLSMNQTHYFGNNLKRRSGFQLKHDENDQQIIYSNNVRLIVKSTKDTVASLLINKIANGKDYLTAKNRAQAINYSFDFDQNKLSLDGFFTANPEHKYRDQEIELTLYLPIGSYLFADKNTYSFHRNSSRYDDILLNGQEEYYLEIKDDKTFCQDCTPQNEKYQVIDFDDENWDETWEEGNRIKINKDGIDINVADQKDSVKVEINKQGIKVKTN